MTPPAYTLYTPEGSFRAFAPLVAAEVNELHVTVITNEEILHQVASTQSPTGKLPFMTSADDSVPGIFSSLAMARFLAGLRPDTGLLGSTLAEQLQVDYWMDWTIQEIEVPACVLFYPKVGVLPDNPDAYVSLFPA